MELQELIIIILTVLGGLGGLLYRSLAKRLDALESHIHDCLHPTTARQMMDDKIAPYKVEVLSILRELADLKTDQLILQKKVDKLLELMSQRK